MTCWLPIAMLAALIVIFIVQLANEKAPHELNENTGAMVGKTVPATSLPILKGDIETFDAAMASERPVILNFFASWCTPCLAEHAQLLALKEAGFTVYGIAWRDSAKNIQGWLDEHGNPYDAVWLDESGNSAIPFGLRGVPETYVVQNGAILFHQAGVVTDAIRQQQLLPYLEVHDEASE